MSRPITYSLIFFILSILGKTLAQSPEHFVKLRQFQTNALHVFVTNDGRLQKLTGGILLHKDNFTMSVFDHSLFLAGYRDEQLIGTAPFWCANYTPGPIINNHAAIEMAPQDSAAYRTYIISKQSKAGDADYDEWPAHWGAPVTKTGQPKLHGDITAWSVYNDAHPDVHSRLETNSGVLANTDIEIRETIWGYDRPGLLGQTLFFKWQLYNRGDRALDSLVIGHWHDIDLNNDYPFSSPEYGFGYVFSPKTDWPSCAAAYILLQGPLVSSPGNSGYAFDREQPGYQNVPTTAYWGILDDSISEPRFGSTPDNMQQLYYVATGRQYDGHPIVNPVAGDTTAFTYTGDPVALSGWTGKGSGGCGGVAASGPLTMAQGDSQEVVYALIFATAESNELTWNQLLGHYLQINAFYLFGEDIPGPPASVPNYYTLKTNYPNPFNSRTTISYTVPLSSNVAIKVYNIRGEIVAVLTESFHEQGEYIVDFCPAPSLSSGVYAYQLVTPFGRVTKKMALVK